VITSHPFQYSDRLIERSSLHIRDVLSGLLKMSFWVPIKVSAIIVVKAVRPIITWLCLTWTENYRIHELIG